MPDFEFNLFFSDTTVLETDGEFIKVQELMLDEPPNDERWMLETRLTVEGPGVVSEMKLHLWNTGDIHIVSYQGPVVFYNPDLQCLSEWAQQRGWKIPQPSKDLVRGNMEFWKHYWNAMLVDSDYLDELFGKREHVSENWDGKPGSERD